ncbi:unnamed protein product [Rotaria sp. Silwood1]|nr:unnamed protein product [Rotaria sp. Silwood1]CAF4843717.1 unnamed protein product [Rotaria sp. Silwood1]
MSTSLYFYVIKATTSTSSSTSTTTTNRIYTTRDDKDVIYSWTNGAASSPATINQVNDTTKSTLTKPRGMIFDKYGNLYVADKDNNRVMYCANSTVGIVLVDDSTTSPKLYKPVAVALDSNLNLASSFCSCTNASYFFNEINDWTRLLGAIKITLIIGISSIFVMIPTLAKTLGNGQFILVTICMTIGDTVGGTFTTMKIRLIGVVLGSMWAYIVSVTALNNVVQIFGMLAPWIFGCGFLKLVPEWGPTVLVATTTPMMIVLGRLPYYTGAPIDASAVLSIKEIAVALGLGVVLTIIIFPQFAVDLLKENIQSECRFLSILQICRKCVESMDNSFEQVFHQNDKNECSANSDELIDVEVKPFFDSYQLEFHRLMNIQQILLGYASLEPTFWWFKNDFPIARYTLLAQQQSNMFQLLQIIDRALLCINECSVEDRKLHGNLQDQTIGDRFFSNLREPLADLTRQLNNCLNLWSSYFSLTQTRCYRAIYECNCSSLTNFSESDLTKHETYFAQLLQAISYFKEQHQQSLNRMLEYFQSEISEGNSLRTLVPNINNDHIDSILIATTSMFYSQSQLIHAALALGTTIYTILQLEKTDLYQAF